MTLSWPPWLTFGHTCCTNEWAFTCAHVALQVVGEIPIATYIIELECTRSLFFRIHSSQSWSSARIISYTIQYLTTGRHTHFCTLNGDQPAHGVARWLCPLPLCSLPIYMYMQMVTKSKCYCCLAIQDGNGGMVHVYVCTVCYNFHKLW